MIPKKYGIIAVISTALYIVIAIALTFSEAPDTAEIGASEGLKFDNIVQSDYSDLPALTNYETRNSDRLTYRYYPASQSNANTLILVHGSGWHGMQFHEMAKSLSAKGQINVVVPDLRGHGATPTRRGDVDHIGQLEEDMADLITHLKKGAGAQKIVLGGHSSGGGLVIRFAGSEFGNQADGFILLAPFLKYNAPTTRENSGGWARPAVRRIIGLSMLNMGGITIFNDLPVIGFAMPKSVLKGPLGHTATTQYSYRMNTSFAPRSDYEKDIKAMTQPFLLLAGSKDEAFHAGKYERVMSAHSSSGTYKILQDVTHLDIVSNQQAIEEIVNWLPKATN